MRDDAVPRREGTVTGLQRDRRRAIWCRVAPAFRAEGSHIDRPFPPRRYPGVMAARARMGLGARVALALGALGALTGGGQLQEGEGALRR